MEPLNDLENEVVVSDPYEDDEEDELDLIKLVSTNANDTSQYLVFVGSDNQYYAKNVSKIEELLVYKELNIARNNNDNLIVGTANIRGNMTTIVNFDRWMGNIVLDDKDYELVIVAHYGGHRMGIVVKRVEYIVNIPSDTMVDNSDSNEKTSFVTNVLIGGKEVLCLIFDSDKLLLDVFSRIDAQAVKDTHELHQYAKSDKIILFADDSKFIRSMVEELFKKMGVHYHSYENGQLLFDAIKAMDINKIGLVVTDLEMPVMSGRDLIDRIRNDKDLKDIKIIVHTNMSNSNIENTLLSKGVNEIIGKVDMINLSEAIIKHMV